MFNDTAMHMPGPQQLSEPWHCRLSQQCCWGVRSCGTHWCVNGWV